MIGIAVFKGIDEHTAGGKDVFATAAANGGGQTVFGEIIAHPLHLSLVAGGECQRVVCVGHLLYPRMETDEVDTAVEVAQEAQEFVGVFGRIVDARPADILETDTALVLPIVLLEKSQDIAERIEFLHRHNLLTLNGEGVVERDSQVALTLIQKAFQTRDNAHR